MIVKWLVAAAIIWVVWTVLRRPARPRPTVRLDREGARALLDVSPDADAETIRAAHRHLIATAHPDHGGPDEIAKRLNAARDLLLRDLRE